MTDLEAIKQCKNGNLGAFSTLYDEYIKVIYYFIFYKTHHKETAEDLTSITFTKALEKIATFDEEKSSFKTWIYQIARNTVIDHYRTNKEVSDIDDAWDISSKEDIVSDTDTNLKINEVKKYLKELKSDQREIVLLRVWGDKSFKEIAEITGKTESACKMSYGRTIEKIKGDIAILLIILINL